MMVPFSIVDSSKPQPGTKQQLKDTKTPLPAVSLPDPSGRKTDLSQLKDQTLVVVFFRGASCFHCTEQLRELIALARKSPDFNAEIVAISSEPIEDAAKASQILASTPTDRFRLLVDADRTSFKDFGCVKDGDPKHALFVVSRNGTIRSSYIGETPYGDVQEVHRRVRQLNEFETTSVR
jgi:peroxiredoxin